MGTDVVGEELQAGLLLGRAGLRQEAHRRKVRLWMFVNQLF